MSCATFAVRCASSARSCGANWRPPTAGSRAVGPRPGGARADASCRIRAVRVAERLAVLLARSGSLEGPAEFELVLAAAVTEHHRNSQALTEALVPLTIGRATERPSRWEMRDPSTSFGCLLDALTGRRHHAAAHTAEFLSPPMYSRGPGMIPALPVLEAAARVADDPVPVLLATPTTADGALDPAVFTARLDAHRAAGTRPWPANLAQALLRLPPGAVADVTAEVRDLGCELPSAELAAPDGFHTQRPGMPERPEGYGRRPPIVPRIVPVGRTVGSTERSNEGETPGEPTLDSRADQLATLLSVVPDPARAMNFTGSGGDSMRALVDLAQLTWLSPWHPETAAAHAIPALVVQAAEAGGPRRPNPVLPWLAEAPGTQGPVCHLALAYGLTAARADNRTAALDALLILAARGVLRPESLATWTAALWRLRSPSRTASCRSSPTPRGPARTAWCGRCWPR